MTIDTQDNCPILVNEIKAFHLSEAQAIHIAIQRIRGDHRSIPQILNESPNPLLHRSLAEL